MVVLPALVALPAVKVKLTALPDKFTVNDSGSVAVNVMVCGGLEFNCAEAPETTAIVNRATINNRAQFIEIDFIRMSFSRFLLVKHSFYCTRLMLGVIAYWVLLTGSCSLGLAHWVLLTGSCFYRVLPGQSFSLRQRWRALPSDLCHVFQLHTASPIKPE